MAHEEDNIDTSMVAVVGVIAAGLSFGLIILLMVLYHVFNNSQEMDALTAPIAETERIWSGQLAVMNEAAWVNQETGQVRIPVDQAMSLVVDQLQETPDDAGVNPPEFADSDATITPTAADAVETGQETSESGESSEPAGEKPPENDGSNNGESTSGS